MVYLIIIFSAIAVVALTVSGFYLVNKRYDSFVLKNSECLRNIKKINSEFIFFPYVNFDQTYTYDNETYYETVSCEDFLIYQLQYYYIKVKEQMEKIERNKTEYRKYLNKINELRYGNFFAPTKNLKQKKLSETEKKICDKAKLSPPATRLSITVMLFCSKINGEVYASKKETFSAEKISVLIKRLNNKYGTYYRDREIWEAICRTERAKVSNKMRFSIYARDGYRCRKCGVSQRFATLEIDHIIPIAKGGKSTYDNLQTLCHKCNVEKGDKI